MVSTGQNPIPTCLVVVEFGDVLRPGDHERLRGLAQEAGASIVHVRTDRKPGLSLADPNCAFEFSGFQDGLQAALDRVLGPDAAGWIRLVFVNDTVFRSHLPPFARALVAALLAVPAPGQRGGMCVGLAGRVSASLDPGTGDPGHYVSTWAFAVIATRESLQRLRFFDDGATRAAFAATVWSTLPEDYRNSIDTWLEPVHYLKGWYQALPGRPLDADTRERKRFSIYLEHTLAQRAARAGIGLVDIGDTGTNVLARFAWNAGRLADRIYCNLDKLQRRARATLTAN